MQRSDGDKFEPLPSLKDYVRNERPSGSSNGTHDLVAGRIRFRFLLPASSLDRFVPNRPSLSAPALICFKNLHSAWKAALKAGKAQRNPKIAGKNFSSSSMIK